MNSKRRFFFHIIWRAPEPFIMKILNYLENLNYVLRLVNFIIL